MFDDPYLDPRGMLVVACLSVALLFWNNDVMFYGCCLLAAGTCVAERLR